MHVALPAGGVQLSNGSCIPTVVVQQLIRGLSSGSTSGGATYTRWGRRVCPDTPGTEQTYEGRMVGSTPSRGGGANHLCLSNSPTFLAYTRGSQDWRATLHGTEYETNNGASGPFESLHDHNVPCAVCYVNTRVASIMIPGQTICPVSWTVEYYGYLMATSKQHRRTMFVCVDVNAAALPGEAHNTLYINPIYHVEGATWNCTMSSLRYRKESTCVVCTK